MSQPSQTESDLDRMRMSQARSKAVVPQNRNISRSGVQIQSRVQAVNSSEPNSTLYILTPAVNKTKQNNQPRQFSQANQLVPVNQPRQLQPAAKTAGTIKNENNNNNIKDTKKQPPVKRLAQRFKKNGLGFIDSYFNAYFFYYQWKSAKKNRKTKDNPDNPYKKHLDFLTLIARLWGVICNFFTPARIFAKSFLEFFSTLGNSAKAAKNIGYLTKKSLNFLVPVAAIIFTVTTIQTINSFKPELELTFNGQNLGYVDSKETVGKVISLVENNVSSVLNEPYEYTADLSYRIVLTKNQKNTYVSESELYNVMYDSSQVQSAITTAFGLYIDGELVVAMENESDIKTVLQAVLDENLDNDGDGTIEYVNEITIIENKYAKRDVVSQDALKNIMTYSAESTENPEDAQDSSDTQISLWQPSEYAVEIADAYVPLSDGNFGSSSDETADPGEDIAAVAAASLSDLTPEAINAIPRGFISSAASAYDINPYDEILSKLSKPAGNMSAGVIQFKKTKTMTYTTEVPFEVKYVDSNQYYVGTQTVQTNGKSGETSVTADVTYIGDQEISREIKETAVIREPVTKVVLVGTKPKPVAGPTGGFIRPVKGGYYTSRFTGGHRGLDLVVPYGSPIYAADGGTVIYAGFSGSYGNHVKIRHSDGFVTLYAHMSSIGVSNGDKLFQGQEIGKVGSTGYSTGPHLHFEIMKNGVLVNPESYIK